MVLMPDPVTAKTIKMVPMASLLGTHHQWLAWGTRSPSNSSAWQCCSSLLQQGRSQMWRKDFVSFGMSLSAELFDFSLHWCQLHFQHCSISNHLSFMGKKEGKKNQTNMKKTKKKYLLHCSQERLVRKV